MGRYQFIRQDAKDALDGAMSSVHHMDSPGAGAWFERELEYIMPEVVKDDTGPLSLRTLIPIGTEIPVGAKTYTQVTYSELGLAKWISDYSAELPLVDVGYKEDTRQLRRLGAAYQYNIDELAAGMMARLAPGRALDRDRGVAAKNVIEQGLNRACFEGNTALGIFGILNHPNIPKFTLADPIDITTDAEDITENLLALARNIFKATKSIGRPSRLALATDPYGYITTARASATSPSDTTISEFILAKSSLIKEIVCMPELDGIGPNGEDGLFLFEPNPRKIRFEISQDFTQLPAEAHALSWVINCTAKCGGINVLRPLEMALGYIPAT